MKEINVDIARALKDKTYFDSLTEEQKRRVREANPVGESKLGDEDLDSVSGGLEGGAELLATTTSTKQACTCEGGTGTCSCSC